MDVVFTFKAIADNELAHWDQSNRENNVEGEFVVNHSSSATLKNVYLLLEYTVDSGAETGILTPYNLYRA